MKFWIFLVLAAFTITAGAQRKQIFIHSTLKPCAGVAVDSCMQYRESPDEPWKILHGNIEGFNYEQGYAYVLRIKESKIKNPPADGSSIRRKLIKIKSKTPEMSVALPHQPIAGKYKITFIKGQPEQDVIPGDYTVAFDDQQVSGKVCNNFRASYHTSPGNILAVGQAMSTRMACPNLPLESALLAALTKVNHYSLENGQLVLRKDGEVMIILVAADTPPGGDAATGADFREAIRSTSFGVTTLYRGTDKIGLEKGKVSVRLDDLKSSITGKGPCNSFFGTAKMEFTAANRGTIQMGGIGSTMMACDPEIMDQEKLFFQLLQQADHFEYQHGALTFRAGEKILIEMQSQDVPAQSGK